MSRQCRCIHYFLQFYFIIIIIIFIIIVIAIMIIILFQIYCSNLSLTSWHFYWHCCFYHAFNCQVLSFKYLYFFFIEKNPHEISIVAKLNKCALSDLWQFLATNSPLKIIKNVFLYCLKNSFRSQDI